jgi:hypothetical protein
VDRISDIDADIGEGIGDSRMAQQRHGQPGNAEQQTVVPSRPWRLAVQRSSSDVAPQTSVVSLRFIAAPADYAH